MKIKSIRFLNLNSLRGEHEICFDAPPLADSGLFAITGPTGAGKSTILDAITLGLYGRVNRHDRDLPAEIMTRHTAEAYSEVTFEARNVIYRAKWHVYRSRRKPDGNLQPVKMELCKVADEIPFDLKSFEVPAKVSELCGLDYSQFLRSVMLSQGEFTRFLKAPENERSELLERITDTGIYTDISRQAYRRAAVEKNALQLLKNELSGQTLLSPELLAEHETALATYRDQEAMLKQTRRETETQIAWLNHREKLAEKQTQTQKALAELHENAARYEPEFARLEQHKLALNFRPDLVKLEREQQLLSELEHQQNHLQTQLPELKLAVKTGQENAESAKTVQETAEKVLREAGPLLDEVLRRDAEIASLRQQFLKNKDAYQQAKTILEKEAAAGEVQQKSVAELRQKLTELQNWLSEHSAEKSLGNELNIFERHLKDLEEIIRAGHKWKKEKQVATETQELAQTQAQLSAKKLAELAQEKQKLQAETAAVSQSLTVILAGTSEAALEQVLQQLPARLSTLEKLQKLAFQFANSVDKERKVREREAAEKVRQEQLNQAEKETQTQLEAARTLLQQYQEIFEFQLQVQNYEAARQHLQLNCECPLCGALEHPFASGAPKMTDATGQRNRQQETVARLEENRSKFLTELAAVQANLQATEIAILENRELQAEIERDFSALNEALENKFSLLEPDAIREAIIATETQFQAEKVRFEKIKTANLLIRELADRQHHLQEEILTESGRKEQAEDRVKTAGINRQLAEKEWLDLQEQFTQISTEASSFALRFGLTFSPENGSALGKQLREMAETYAEKTEVLQTTNLRLAEAEGNLQEITAMQLQKHQQLATLETRLTQEHRELTDLKKQREDRFGQKDPVEERAILTSACEAKKTVTEAANQTLQQHSERLKLAEARLEQLRLETTQALNKVLQFTQELTDKLSATSLGSIAALKQQFLPENEAARLTSLQVQLEKLLTETRQTLADTAAELKAETARNLTTETVGFLTEKLLETDRLIGEANQQIGSISQILKRESEMQEKHRELAERIALQQKETARWEQLSELIGSESGKKFSKFAQGLTLAKLVTLANRHLGKLNDRYRLQKTPGADLELQMIDMYQADAVRSVNTLSGGESFLVSLALALGLSDLASHKTQIDSLFIDEGFGTLDAETLDVAVTALENLQASGKMIGIISHVEALKERIGTQIRVKKMSGGLSMIELTAFAGQEF